MADSSPNQNAVMLRNIIVGVATSVIGAASLYFLGINKSGQSSSAKASFAETKEATVKGWKTYVAEDNIYYKNLQSVFNDFKQDQQWDNFKENYLKEMRKFQNDMDIILKDETMDISFISMLKRRQEIEKESETKLSNYIDNVKIILNDNTMGNTDKQQKFAQENQRFTLTVKGMNDRSITEVEGLSKVLIDKYGQSFDLNDFTSYKDYKNGTTTATKKDYGTNPTTQPENVVKNNATIPAEPQTNPSQYSSANTNTGNKDLNTGTGMFGGDWTSAGGYLHFDNRGFTWQWTDGKGMSQGAWNAQNGKMVLNITSGYNTGYSWTFILSNLTPNSFTMQLENNPNFTYYQVKKTN